MGTLGILTSHSVLSSQMTALRSQRLQKEREAESITSFKQTGASLLTKLSGQALLKVAVNPATLLGNICDLVYARPAVLKMPLTFLPVLHSNSVFL